MNPQETPLPNVPTKRLREAESEGYKHSTHPSACTTNRVLVAEDDPALRELMAQVLAFEGYFVTEAADGFALLKAIRANYQDVNAAFDLIVTDVRMPGLGGLDALASIRKSGCSTPVIVVSALPQQEVQERVEHLNALYMQKPFNLECLRKIANRIVADNQNESLEGA